ncbi:MAG: isochorismatase family protein, partial [Bacteroidota bacterium]
YEATNLNLEQFLKQEGIDELFVAGLATDYCVRASALDAVGKGFKTHVITDAVAAVNVSPDDGEKALEELQKAGVTLVTSKEAG